MTNVKLTDEQLDLIADALAEFFVSIHHAKEKKRDVCEGDTEADGGKEKGRRRRRRLAVRGTDDGICSIDDRDLLRRGSATAEQ